jgi:uncharacterized protein YkwD
MRTVALLTSALGCLLAAIFAVPAIAAAASSRLDNRERAIVHRINVERANHGLSAVKPNKRLARAADYHSWEMLDANYFAHESRNGGSFDARINRFTHKHALGETLAMIGGRCGRGSARRIVGMWMNSPGHRDILLSSTYSLVGVAARAGSLGGTKACVVTADFGSRR